MTNRVKYQGHTGRRFVWLDEVEASYSLADAAARGARSVPVAEVMRPGDRRRRRRRTLDNILAARVVSGVVVAVVVMTGTGCGDAMRPSATLSAATMPGDCTERLTLTAPDGRMSACASYRYGPSGNLQVRGVEASFVSASGYALPYFTFAFRNARSGMVDYQFSTPPVQANAARSYGTGSIMLGTRKGIRHVRIGDVLDITLNALDQTGIYYSVATLSLSLNRHGLQCPEMGTAWLGNTPQC